MTHDPYTTSLSSSRRLRCLPIWANRWRGQKSTARAQVKIAIEDALDAGVLFLHSPAAYKLVEP